MNFTKTALFLFSTVLFFACSPKIYKAANFDESKNTVKTIAILPFNVSIDAKRLPKGVTVQTLKESQERTGYDIQNKAYTWLLQRHQNYTVNFQDVDRTNSLIRKANLDYETLHLTDKAELCKILGVDAILSGKAIMSKPMSEGAAVALGILVGAWGTTNQTSTALSIHDTAGNLLWKYDYDASGSIGSNPESLASALMRNASRKFPYTVDKNK